jgi:hypothetical protein
MPSADQAEAVDVDDAASVQSLHTFCHLSGATQLLPNSPSALASGSPMDLELGPAQPRPFAKPLRSRTLAAKTSGITPANNMSPP